jgi:hypothetical protein
VDIRPGITVIVPADADLLRKTPYRLKITRVDWVREDMAGVAGEVYRLDGSPSRRGHASWGTRQVTAHRAAVINTSRVRLVEDSPS